MPVIFPKRAGQDNAVATDDSHHAALVSDPSVPQFPQGSTFGSNDFANQSGQTQQSGFSSFGGSSSQGFAGNTNIGTQINQSPAQNLTQAGSNAAQDAEVLVQHDKESTDWINKKWRPAMGWSYMITCITDFVVFPVLWSLLQAMSKGQVTSQWQPVTLMGAGLYHVAMGAIIGVTAYGRTKEKLAEKS